MLSGRYSYRDGTEGAVPGYVLLLPDLFYRYGSYWPFVPKEVFAGDFSAILGPLIVTTDNDWAAGDREAFLACRDARSDVASRKVGAVGFCMGGAMATDAPASPHLFAPELKAEWLCRGRRE